MWYGEGLMTLVVRAGEFLYIPANVPHLPYNLEPDTACVAAGAHRPQRAGERCPVRGPKLEGPPTSAKQ
jgi:uncharacterized RmlC-like cupin family protein